MLYKLQNNITYTQLSPPPSTDPLIDLNVHNFANSRNNCSQLTHSRRLLRFHRMLITMYTECPPGAERSQNDFRFPAFPPQTRKQITNECIVRLGDSNRCASSLFFSSFSKYYFDRFPSMQFSNRRRNWEFRFVLFFGFWSIKIEKRKL